MSKSAFIGIIGRPNVGKSTLLNQILGEKIAITTPKPQTTRNSIRGIYTNGDTQLVFIDTPGIHKARTKLGSAMSDMALSTLGDVDLVLLLLDATEESGPGDRYIMEMLRQVDTPCFLLLNKIDAADPDRFKALYDRYVDSGDFDRVFGISALDGKNVDQLLQAAEALAEEGPMYFPADMITESPERFLVSELIREKVLLYLEEEIPHGVAVEIESFQEEEGLTRIGAVIYCEKKSHKGIIIGKQGRKLKGIGKAARMEIEGLLGTHVFLELWVKVKENWRNSDFALSHFGYKEQE